MADLARNRIVPLLGGTAFVALFLRIVFTLCHYQKGDGVIVGEMALDIATGVDFPLWYYGGPYAGTFEAWFTAPLMAITGPTWWGVAFAPVVISTAGIIPFYLLGASLHSRRAGLFAAILWAVAPFGAMFYNITPRGAYPETICGGALLLWYATERWKGRTFNIGAGLAMGLMAGVILWSRMLIAPAVATVAIAELWRWRMAAFNRLNVAFAVGTLVGALPIFFNLDAILHNPSVGKMDPMGALGRVEAYWVTLRWAFLPDDPAWLLWLGHGVWLIMAASVAVVLLIAGGKLIAGKLSPSATSWGPLAIFILLFSFIYLSNTASTSDQIRYATPLFSALFPAVGIVAAWLYGRRAVYGVVLTLFIVGVNLAVNGVLFAGLADERRGLEKEIGGTVDRLHALEITGLVHEEYDRTMRIQYDARVRGIDLTVMKNVGGLKYDWSVAVEKNTTAALLVPPHEKEDYARWLRQCCGDFSVEPVEGYALFYRMAPPPPTPMVAVASDRMTIDQGAEGLIDRNHATTWWGEGTQTTVIELAEPMKLTRARLILGGRWPQSIRLETSMDRIAWSVISDGAPSFVYPVGPRPYMRLSWDFDREYEEWNVAPTMARFVRLTMVATGAWDAHELFLYAVTDDAPSPSAWEASPDEVMATVKGGGVTWLGVNRWWRANLDTAAREVGIPLSGLGFIEATRQDHPRMRLAPGIGGLVDPAEADELARRLTIQNVSFRRIETIAGPLFVFDGDGGDGWWTGFTFIGDASR